MDDIPKPDRIKTAQPGDSDYSPTSYSPISPSDSPATVARKVSSVGRLLSAILAPRVELLKTQRRASSAKMGLFVLKAVEPRVRPVHPGIIPVPREMHAKHALGDIFVPPNY